MLSRIEFCIIFQLCPLHSSEYHFSQQVSVIVKILIFFIRVFLIIHVVFIETRKGVFSFFNQVHPNYLPLFALLVVLNSELLLTVCPIFVSAFFGPSVWSQFVFMIRSTKHFIFSGCLNRFWSFEWYIFLTFKSAFFGRRKKFLRVVFKIILMIGALIKSDLFWYLVWKASVSFDFFL